MRPTKLPFGLFLSILLIIFGCQTVAIADDNDGDEYDVKARVVRVSLIHGDVSLRRPDGQDWETAQLNVPLVEGDTLATGKDGRAEIQIDARNFVRLASDSVLKIATLRDDGIALSLAEGTATVRLAKFDKDHEFFEIDAPKTTIAAENIGLYRIDADRKGKVIVTVRFSGRARVYSDSAGFTVLDGRSATLKTDGEEAGDWQLAYAAANDNWDDWVKERERYLASLLKYEQNARYYDADIWGAEDLDAYGTWSYVDDYGWIWRPNVTIINNFNDWVPYRYGSWVWCSPYGWTWVGNEPWGWAPYHYGRWVYYNNYWAWCPHSYYRGRRSWWAPALVAFFDFDFNFGRHYCWYPLHYHQRDPRSVYVQTRERLTPLRANELASLQRRNPAYLRAVTAVPARDFGGQSARLQAANVDLARRAMGAEPLRRDLPARPTVGSGDSTTSRAARPAVPATGVASRPTGAAVRTPGVSLDNELRRQRIFNGRDPVSTRPPDTTTTRTPDTTSTGAVTRSARPSGSTVVREPDRTADRTTRPATSEESSSKRSRLEVSDPDGPSAPRNEPPR